MDFLTTVKGSLLEGFYPKGWDMEKIDKCCDMGVKREDFWNKDFNPIECENIYEFDTLMDGFIAETLIFMKIWIPMLMLCITIS